MLETVYYDSSIFVCVKPAGVLSTDEPGGMPELARQTLGDESACVRTVHRLDRVVGGLMVLARSPESASELSRQIREGEFDKSYLAVVHGVPDKPFGRYTDLLLRSKPERKTYVVKKRAKDVQEAILDYKLLETSGGLSLVEIKLVTGRTHQIRCQFSSRGLALVGDRKYSTYEDGCNIGLWSQKLSFYHPQSRSPMEFALLPRAEYPWSEFEYITKNQ